MTPRDHHLPSSRPLCLTRRPGHGSARARADGRRGDDPGGGALASFARELPRFGEGLRRGILQKRGERPRVREGGPAPSRRAAAPTDARRRGRARGPASRKSSSRADPAFKPARIATISQRRRGSGPTGSTRLRRPPRSPERPTAAAARLQTASARRTIALFFRRRLGFHDDAYRGAPRETPAVGAGAWRLTVGHRKGPRRRARDLEASSTTRANGRRRARSWWLIRDARASACSEACSPAAPRASTWREAVRPAASRASARRRPRRRAHDAPSAAHSKATLSGRRRCDARSRNDTGRPLRRWGWPFPARRVRAAAASACRRPLEDDRGTRRVVGYGPVATERSRAPRIGWRASRAWS